jgi:hypothetical protein
VNEVPSHQKVLCQPQNIRMKPSALVVESSVQQGVGWPLHHEEVETMKRWSSVRILN